MASLLFPNQVFCYTNFPMFISSEIETTDFSYFPDTSLKQTKKKVALFYFVSVLLKLF